MYASTGNLMDPALSDFAEFPFPENRHIVYVLCYVSADAPTPVPFYVGQSSRHLGRLGDYISANFSAATDFAVGEAIKFLRQHGCCVICKFKESRTSKSDENTLIASFKSKGFRLLNDLGRYDYLSANPEHVRDDIHHFMEILVAQESARLLSSRSHRSSTS